jgi:hypothetical protein
MGVKDTATLADYAMQKLSELGNRISRSRSEFMASYGPQKAEIESYKTVPELFDRASESLRSQMDIYFDTLDEFFEKFRMALQTRIGI